MKVSTKISARRYGFKRTHLTYAVVAAIFLSSGHVTDGQATVKTNSSSAAAGLTEYVGVAKAVQFNGTSYAVASFLGIQYAAAPAGERRFSKPEPYAPDNATSYNATQLKAACHQPASLTDNCLRSQRKDEDCLHLNIYVPTPTMKLSDVANASATLVLPDASRAVYVYIHGGGFYEGSGNCNDGSVLASYGDVIYVTFNYRLGALGFLTTDDGVVPANLGLWDQQAAIRWVSQNIRAFGGDPTKITIGGQSAGGMSSILQGLYPGNDKLFKRVIAQSGIPASPKSIVKSGYATALRLANLFGCNVTGEGKSQDIRTCLMRQNASDLSGSVVPLEVPLSLVYSPTLDGDMVKADTYALFRNAVQPGVAAVLPEAFLNKDLLVGFTAEDGEVIYRLRWLQMAKESKNLTILSEAVNSFITMRAFTAVVFEYLAGSFNDTVDDLLLNAVLDRYVDWGKMTDPTSVGYQTVKMLTDAEFAVPISNTALGRSSARDSNSSYTGATYVYRLNLPADNMYYQKSNLPWLKGTSHSDDLSFVFGKVSDGGSFDICKSVMTYWTNFVKTGNPNTPFDNQTSPDVITTWPAFTSANQTYLDISNPSVARQQLASDSRHFWQDFLPDLFFRLSASTTTPPPVVCPNKPANAGTRLVSVSGASLLLCLFIVLTHLSM